MKRQLLSVLVLYCFLASSIYSTPVEQAPIPTNTKAYIMKLERQLKLSQTLIVTLEKALMELENYKNNLTSYNLSTTKLSEKEKLALQEDKLMNEQLEKSIQQLRTQLTEAMKQSTIITENLKIANEQIDKAKELNDKVVKDLEKEKKKTKFWKIAGAVASFLAFLAGGYLGFQFAP